MTTPEQRPRSRRFTVVVADDDDRVREALNDLINDNPRLRVVGTASSGTGAAALCSMHQPHLAVVDVMMPTGGAEAIKAISQVSPLTLVVVYTVRRDRRTRERLAEAGAAAVFTKGALRNLGDALVALAVEDRPIPDDTFRSPDPSGCA
ncbi:MAG: response regulator [Acidimicrobiia bacterium]|nr:response regulator [Acidimicrobiia bacterium]MDH5519673.1 response regulator [Acidimicrobiia bacterium]